MNTGDTADRTDWPVANPVVSTGAVLIFRIATLNVGPQITSADLSRYLVRFFYVNFQRWRLQGAFRLEIAQADDVIISFNDFCFVHINLRPVPRMSGYSWVPSLMRASTYEEWYVKFRNNWAHAYDYGHASLLKIFLARDDAETIRILNAPENVMYVPVLDRNEYRAYQFDRSSIFSRRLMIRNEMKEARRIAQARSEMKTSHEEELARMRASLASALQESEHHRVRAETAEEKLRQMLSPVNVTDIGTGMSHSTNKKRQHSSGDDSAYAPKSTRGV